MVNKATIESTLERLNKRYEEAQDNFDLLYNSKLALIEVSGWTEVTMDSIVYSFAKEHLEGANNLEYVKKTVIERTYGFTYDRHFRRMLIQVAGLAVVERVETCLDQAIFTQMKASLGNLSTRRNREAHTYIDGPERRIDSPSVISKYFKEIYEGLQEIENCLRAVKF